MAPSILVVDDEPNVALTLGAVLAHEGFRVDDATTYDDALAKIHRERYDVAVLDLRFGQHDGLDVLAHLKSVSPGTIVLVLTGFGSMETAIQALRAGALDYLQKPCDLDELKAAIARGLEGRGPARADDARPAAPLTSTSAQRADVLSIAAHELRTPLASVLGWAQYLQHCLDRGREEQARERAPLLVGQARRLARLLEAILDLELIVRGELRLAFKRLDLGALADQAIGIAGATYPHHHFRLTKPLHPISVLGDGPRLGLVLGNVLDCCARSSPWDSEILVSLSATPQHARAELRCHCAAMSGDEFSAALAAWRQDDPGPSMPYGGLGLSLFVARALVEAHGGQLRADADETSACTFTISLPLAE